MFGKFEQSLASPDFRSVESADSNRVRDKIIEVLKKEAVIKEQDEFLIFDMKRFMDEEFLGKLRYRYSGKFQDKRIRLNTARLYEALGDLSVISQDDYERIKSEGADIKPKPLFNVPGSASEAFDAGAIKSRDYYLNIWDLSSRTSWNDLDIRAKNGDELNSKEFFLATRLFKDCQAKRENDELMVFDPDRNEFINVSVVWMKKNIGFREMTDSIHEFLLKECPHLVANGSIKLGDFKIKTNDRSGVIMRKEFTVSKKSSEVMINSVRYYIGRKNFIFNGKKIPTENIKIAVIDEDTAGVIVGIDGQEKIICLFQLLSQEEKDIKRKEVAEKSEKSLHARQISMRSFIGKKEMENRIQPWLRTKDNPVRKGETPEQYAERIAILGDYGFLKKISSDFSNECGIGIHNLSWREQQWLSAAVFELNVQGKKQELFDFTKKFGLAGLKTFLACEFDIENGKKILEIGKSLDQAGAMAVFQKAGEIINLAEDKKREIAGILGAKADSEIEQGAREKLLRKASQIIIDFSAAGKKDISKLLTDLENNKLEISLLSSLLRTAKENSLHLDMDEIKEIGLEKRDFSKTENEGDPDVLSEEEKSEMPRIIEKNYREDIYPDNPLAAEKVISDFKKELDNGLEGNILYTLRFQG